jgi:hypothetical protein
MKYWIQRHDYSGQDFPKVSADEAIAAFSDFDWATELAAGAPDPERNCPPGIGFHNGFGEAENPDPMLLHICPKDLENVSFHFHFGRREARWLFGLLKGSEEQIHDVEDYPIRLIPELIRTFFEGGIDDILAIHGRTSTLQL